MAQDLIQQQKLNKLREKMKEYFKEVKVLLVDDMEENIDNYRMRLVKMGFRSTNIQGEENGLKAITAMVGFKPHVIITDWNMPIMDGLKFVEAVRKEPRNQQIVIFMVTAEAEFDMEKARPYVDAFLRKPTSLATMEKMIVSVLGKKVVDRNHPLGSQQG